MRSTAARSRWRTYCRLEEKFDRYDAFLNQQALGALMRLVDTGFLAR